MSTHNKQDASNEYPQPCLPYPEEPFSHDEMLFCGLYHVFR